jgi:excisionase family DNA binding protein
MVTESLRQSRTVLLRVPQVARVFGVSERTVYRWIDSGLLRPIRVGGTTRFRLDDIERLLEPEEVVDEEEPKPPRPCASAAAMTTERNVA